MVELKRKLHTKIRTEGDSVVVTYYNTEIVSYNRKTNVVMLDNGSYYTQSTRLRMNQVAHEFGLDYKVYQKDYRWYVYVDKYNRHTEFVNGVAFISLE